MKLKALLLGIFLITLAVIFYDNYTYTPYQYFAQLAKQNENWTNEQIKVAWLYAHLHY